MQVNTRRNQIAKSSIYFLLKKKIKAKTSVLYGALDLGVIQFSLENQTLLLYSSNYPEHKICLLRQDPETGEWRYMEAETGHEFAFLVWELSRRQFYPELSSKKRERIIVKVAYEVWRKIESWAK